MWSHLFLVFTAVTVHVQLKVAVHQYLLPSLVCLGGSTDTINYTCLLLSALHEYLFSHFISRLFIC